MFGSHLSIAGSMVNALNEAKGLGLDCVQVFTKNQQQWKAKPLDAGMVTEWHATVKAMGFDQGGPADAKGQQRGGITSHASYLINLAAPAEELWQKSIDLMVDEVERCETLGIPFLIHHPGAYTTSTLDDGLVRIAAAYKRIFARTKGFATVTCLEDTVGAGSQIGGPFEELAKLRKLIIEATGEPTRVGFCLDTCHMHAAGYDMSTKASGTKSLAEFDRVCGLTNLKAFHINDSKGSCASHLDRHMHIGEGTIGGNPVAPDGQPASLARLLDSGFAVVVNHPALAGVPKILETPKEDEPVPAGVLALDTINLRRLKSLVPGNEGLWPEVAEPVGNVKVDPKPKLKQTKARPAPAKVQESKQRPVKSRKTDTAPRVVTPRGAKAGRTGRP